LFSLRDGGSRCKKKKKQEEEEAAKAKTIVLALFIIITFQIKEIILYTFRRFQCLECSRKPGF
jgi:hypothetical protein